MLNRMSVGMFHPRFIFKYIGDSMARVIIYLITLLLISSLPGIIYYAGASDLSDSEIITLKNSIKESSFDILYESHTLFLNDETKIICDTKNFRIATNIDSIDESNTKCNFILKENEVSFYIGKNYIKKVSYDKLNSDFFNLNQNDFKNINQFAYFFNEIYNLTYLPIAKTILITEHILAQVMTFLIFGVMMYFYAKALNPIVPKKISFKIMAYSLTPALIFNFLSDLLGSNLILFIGILISIFYLRLAMKSIVKVEVKK